VRVLASLFADAIVILAFNGVDVEVVAMEQVTIAACPPISRQDAAMARHA
jgi:hypothetical protein